MAAASFLHAHHPFEGAKGLENSCLQLEAEGPRMPGFCTMITDSPLMPMLKNKILSFRHAIHLPPLNGSISLAELIMGTLEDLQKLYPKSMSHTQISGGYDESQETSLVLLNFYEALKGLETLWAENCNQVEKLRSQEDINLKDISLEELGERVLQRIDCISAQAREMPDLMENSLDNSLSKNQQGKPSLYSGSPLTPTSVLPEVSQHHSNLSESVNFASSPPLLQPLRLEAVRKLKPIDEKCFSLHMFPLVSDPNANSMQRTNMMTDELKLDSSEFSMKSEPISNAIIRNDGGGNTTEFSEPVLSGTPLPSLLKLHDSGPSCRSSTSSASLLNEACMPLPSMELVQHSLTRTDRKGGDGIEHSEATTLVSQPTSLPMLQLRAPVLQSPTSTPPSSPMTPLFLHRQVSMLTRLSMYPQTNMELNPNLVARSGDDGAGGTKPPQATILVSSPTLSTMLQLPVPPHNYSNPPLLPSAMLQKENKGLKTPASSEQSTFMPSKEAVVTQTPYFSSSKGCTLSPLQSLPQKVSVTVPPPPPPPKGSACSAPLQPLPNLNGSVPPPPPPFGVAKSLHAKKANIKLKRSTQMGNLYRLLKGKVEGFYLDDKVSSGMRSQIGGVSSGNQAQGMANALAEMTKRSAYFRQIEEDVQKHGTSILEMKSTINLFQTKNMDELIKFHQHVELQLENLTDETQVLARFEGFPCKKLENIRMAAALYSKLNAMVTTLNSWKMVSPTAQQLDKVECYFNKVKKEVDAIERGKEEDSKRFQSHNIDFDFSILVQIKELMVDLSSNCIEMALKECKEVKDEDGVLSPKFNGLSKMLWRVFQLAFRVYNFAGGQDDRADRLTSELAHEIETCPQL